MNTRTDVNGKEARMTRRISAVLLLLLFCFAAGCGKRAQGNDQDAVRASVDRYLTTQAGLNMETMEHEFKQVTVNGDQATAQVEFRVKDGEGKMQMDYVLERKDGDWLVVKTPPSGGQMGHPGMN